MAQRDFDLLYGGWRFFTCNPGLEVSQVKTSRLKKNGQQEPDAISILDWQRQLPFLVGCTNLEKEPRQINYHANIFEFQEETIVIIFYQYYMLLVDQWFIF